MAAFDIDAFVAEPSIEVIDDCRKEDLLSIADYYRITVRAGAAKAKIRDVLCAGLVELGVLSPSAVAGVGALSDLAASTVAAANAFPSDTEYVAAANTFPSDAEHSVAGLATGFGGAAGSEMAGERGEMDGSGNRGEKGPPRVAKPPLVVRPKEPLDPSQRRLELANHSDSAGSTKSQVTRSQVKVRIARLEMQEREKKLQQEYQLAKDKQEKDLQVALAKVNVDKEVRMRQLELEMTEKQRLEEVAARRQASRQVGAGLAEATGTSHFDITRHIGLVPPFREAEVDSYFNAFERVATALAWPTDVWSILLQCKLVGKAQEVLATLSIQDCMNYEKVKAAILRVYERVPEAYRQRFRQHVRASGQTFVEFAREKEALFDRWCAASKVHDFQALRALLLVEEFKRGLPDSICMHLNEQRVTSLSEAAIFADEFVLTHKNVFRGSESSSSKPHKSEGGGRQREDRVCHYCKKVGHLIAQCRLKQREEKNGVKSVGLIRTKESVENAFVGARPGPDASFDPFVFDGEVSVSQHAAKRTAVRMLRDTGAQQSVILAGVLPLNGETECGASAIIRGVEMGYISAPLHKLYVRSDLMSGYFKVAVRDELPIDGISFVMGNDIAGGKVYPVMQVLEQPRLGGVESEHDPLSVQYPDAFPACVVTRAQSHSVTKNPDLSDSIVMRALADDKLVPVAPKALTQRTSVNVRGGEVIGEEKSQLILPVTTESLIKAQSEDPTLEKCRAAVVSQEDIKSKNMGYFCEGGLLLRKWCPNGAQESDWSAVVQIVVPTAYRQQVLSLAHDHDWAGHLGVTKTYSRILKHFFWPGLKQAVSQYCRTCATCQLTGKPNQTIPAAPLCPIPAVGVPFEKVIVDCVGPLPRTKSGNQYLLTIMCAATRFPEAIPLRNITATSVLKALTKFFTTWGFCRVIQTDQGTNFLSRVFKQVMDTLSIHHVVSSAWHPQSQGVLERWHQTLKSMLRKYCLETKRGWDEGIPFVLFAARDAVQESLGFSPNELVFGHTVRGPLKVLKDKLLAAGVSPSINAMEFVTKLKGRLSKACTLARECLKGSQSDMKRQYDKVAVERSFKAGDQVLVLLPIPGSALSARFAGPFVVLEKLSDTNYVIGTPDRRRKSRMCHINMLKPFHVRDGGSVGLMVAEPHLSSAVSESWEDSVAPLTVEDDGLMLRASPAASGRLCNSEMLVKLPDSLAHLDVGQRRDVIRLVREFPKLFGDIPTRTTVLEHDIDVMRARPIKQHAYRVNPTKRALLKKEAEYLLKHDLARPSSSPWSSPCLLQLKSDGSPRFCTDYRKVNAVTVPDSFPLPRMEDCVDNLGSAVFVTKLDLLKGYWQVPLSRRASEISAFVTPDHFLQYNVMAFGMCNAPATFQRLVNIVLEGVPNCNAYLDDVICYTGDWNSHMKLLYTVFARLRKANLTLNLAKCEFGKATVTYLGREVGQGQVRPVEAKVDAITAYPAPTTVRELRRFLGMAGYYRGFCKNFSTVAHPLTSLLSPSKPFIWSLECQHAFETIKSLLCSAPVLSAPDFSRPFALEVDASGVGAGAVLLQEDVSGIVHPVCYFSRKFNKYQVKYATIEQEALAVLFALQFFEVYVGSSSLPVVCYTDHNPLVFLQRMRNHNQRLMRWALLIQDYNLEIRHKKGSDNVIADALSRGW